MNRLRKRMLKHAGIATKPQEDTIMSTADTRYRAGVTVWKAVWTFIATSAGVGVAVVQVQMPETWKEFRAAWPALVVPLGLALWRAMENWRKNSRDDGLAVWQWPWSRLGP